MVRFADDCLLCFNDFHDARRVMDVLPKRFAKWGLELHPDKTNLVNFRNPDRWDNPDRLRSETFDFLGFTHFWHKSYKNSYYIKRKTAKDRLSRSLRKISDWCRKHRHLKIKYQHKKLSQMLHGHCAYFGVYGNSRRVAAFFYFSRRIWFKWLKRRSRLRSLNWVQFQRILDRYRLPNARIVHKYNLVKL